MLSPQSSGEAPNKPYTGLGPAPTSPKATNPAKLLLNLKSHSSSCRSWSIASARILASLRIQQNTTRIPTRVPESLACVHYHRLICRALRTCGGKSVSQVEFYKILRDENKDALPWPEHEGIRTIVSGTLEIHAYTRGEQLLLSISAMHMPSIGSST